MFTEVSIRHTSFFVKLRADEIWKGVTSVSNAGKRRGRGRGAGRRIAKNLNRGQIIGVGKSNMVWPGLNAPVLRGREIVERRQLPPDPDREEKLNKLRDATYSFRSLKIAPIDRGFSGTKMPGRSIGPPDPVGEDTFEGFDTKVLEMKSVFNMSANFGHKRRMSAFVVTGNKNGLAGFGLGKAIENKAALRKAKNRAGQKLMYVERFEEHTVCHDFYSRFGQTKLYVKKKPEGYGLVCHRVLRCICEMIGIKNIYAKVEGPTKNIQNLTKAFFLGLLKQRTHQKLADEKRLYVVEFREERGNLPTVVAAPAVCRTQDEIEKGEVLDYDEVISEGKVELVKPKYPIFYKLLPSWENHIRKTERFRNHYQYKVKITAEHGDLKSVILQKAAEEAQQTEVTD